MLYVNWVDYLDAEGRGGGVSLYQRNLMGARPGADTLFIASGTSYDLPAKAPRWEPMRHGPDADRARRFEIVNSGVLAPGHTSFGDPAQISHPATEAAFLDFIDTHGPFDVVHFNNLEGLPARVLALGGRHPETRVVLSLHNYYPVCPQVNLWFEERAHCRDFEGGAACVKCLPRPPVQGAVRQGAGLAYRLKSAGMEPGTRAYDITFAAVLGLGRPTLRAVRALRQRGGASAHVGGQWPGGDAFAARRAAMVELINTYCDAVLCVSEAVQDIALSYGISPDIAQTCYIGTAQDAAWARTEPKDAARPAGSALRLAYLGYMRRDKGFYFLLDALEAAPDALLSKLHLTVAAKAGAPETVRRMQSLAVRLAGFDWQNGYRHDGLDALLAQIDVGLVPPLWADNLPQVAIEMHARHIPLLCSDMGGARELAGAPDMQFPAGDATAFLGRLQALVDGAVDLEGYWDNAKPPQGMTAHLAELEKVYAGERLS